jgi:hypothetical protein
MKLTLSKTTLRNLRVRSSVATGVGHQPVPQWSYKQVKILGDYYWVC